MKHSSEQTTPASRCDSSGHGKKFCWIILNYERRGGCGSSRLAQWHRRAGGAVWSPFLMAGSWLGDGRAPVHPWVSLLSWDLPGSPQPLNLSFSEILGDPQSTPLLGAGGIAPGAADFLHDLEALSILGPCPASSPREDMEDDPNSGSGRGAPRASSAPRGRKHPCRFPIAVSCSSASPGTVSARAVATAGCSTGFRRGRGAVFCRRSRGLEGCRAGGWAEAQRLMPRCISLCFSGGG